MVSFSLPILPVVASLSFAAGCIFTVVVLVVIAMRKGIRRR